METNGFVFRNHAGQPQDCLFTLRNFGLDSVRLRVFVNPSGDPINGHCSTAETVSMALRAKNAGFRIMIDFHYSDTWSDPGHQLKPAAWSNDSYSQLLTDVYQYTLDVMTNLVQAGVTPEWVQVGNEINPGMLLPDGSSGNFPQLAQLINHGYDAVKVASSNTRVIVHLAEGADNSFFRWFFDGLTSNSTRYDVIGLSYYPYWDGVSYTQDLASLSSNMNDMVSRYGKNVMVVETGDLETNAVDTFNMIAAVLDQVRLLPDGMGLGVFYWEPEGASVWSGYPLSCWNDDGTPSFALNAFTN